MTRTDYQKQHYLRNREKYLQKMRDYKIANRDNILKYKKQNRDENREAIKEYRKLWRIRNKEKIALRRKEYRLNYLKDPKNKLINSFRGQIKRALSNNYVKGSWKKLLGCSVEVCKSYLESKFQTGMTWENHGSWHIDHIKPISSYTLHELHLAFHYTNLQPLWAIDNLRKGSKFEK
jgi:hypothetical protein